VPSFVITVAMGVGSQLNEDTTDDFRSPFPEPDDELLEYWKNLFGIENSDKGDGDFVCNIESRLVIWLI
jgi:hypothetical protein